MFQISGNKAPVIICRHVYVLTSWTILVNPRHLGPHQILIIKNAYSNLGSLQLAFNKSRPNSNEKPIGAEKILLLM